jgi:hypothetical protein
VENKIPKTTGIFDDIDHPKSQGVTYWAERIGLLVDHITQVSCSVAFKKTTCYSLSISRLAACIWINFLNLKGMKWGYVIYHFLYCYINYCILCNEKTGKKAKLSCGNTRPGQSVVFDEYPSDIPNTYIYLFSHTSCSYYSLFRFL